MNHTTQRFHRRLSDACPAWRAQWVEHYAPPPRLGLASRIVGCLMAVIFICYCLSKGLA